MSRDGDRVHLKIDTHKLHARAIRAPGEETKRNKTRTIRFSFKRSSFACRTFSFSERTESALARCCIVFDERRFFEEAKIKLRIKQQGAFRVFVTI